MCHFSSKRILVAVAKQKREVLCDTDSIIESTNLDCYDFIVLHDYCFR